MHRLLPFLFLWSTTIFFAACGGGNANNILTIADTSPSQLDLNLSLSINVNGTSTNYLSITTLQNKTWVAMTHGETMICNGTKLALDPDRIGFTSADFALATPTTPIACFYYSGAHQANFTITPLPPPQVLTPQEGAILSYAQPYTLTYVADKGSNVTTTPYVQVGGKTAGGKSGAQVKSGGYSQQPDNGSIPLNLHGLNAGPGFIQITRFMDAHLDKTGFRSFAGEIDTTTIVNVTWA